MVLITKAIAQSQRFSTDRHLIKAFSSQKNSKKDNNKNNRSAKLRALRAYVLTSQHAFRTDVPTYQRALRVPTYPTCLPAYGRTCLVCLRAYVHTCQRALHAYVLMYLARLSAHVV